MKNDRIVDAGCGNYIACQGREVFEALRAAVFQMRNAKSRAEFFECRLHVGSGPGERPRGGKQFLLPGVRPFFDMDQLKDWAHGDGAKGYAKLAGQFLKVDIGSVVVGVHARPIQDGRVPVGSFTWGAALGQIKGGTLRGIAVTTETRRPEAPDMPTFKELGYDLVASTWFSFAAPKGTPDAVVRRLNAETVRIFKQPDIQKRRAQDAFDPKEFTPEQLTAYFAAEIARWRPVAQAAGMKK